MWVIFSRVYTMPTLVATLFPRILGSGAWQGFLGIRARFEIKRTIFYQWPEICYSYTAIYIYYLHSDTTSTWESSVLSLKIHHLILLIFLIPIYFLSDLKFLIDSYFSYQFYFLILSLGTGYSILKLVAEIRVAQRKRGGSMMRREAILLSFPALSKFWGWNFYKVGRM